MQIKSTSTAAVEAKRENELTVHIGEDAWTLLSKHSFLAGWDTLYAACPWATVFQSRAFVITWYQTYRNKYTPIVVKSVENGKLTGLLTLAKGDSELIVGAGEYQAEYQVWLATNANGEIFIRNALLEIGKRFKGNKVQLKFIPGEAPMNWVKEDLVLKKRCMIRLFRQPLMKIDDAGISNELKKRDRRKKMNRLNRLGELKFERITDSKIFSTILDELIIQFDFRKIAMFNKTFFLNDSLPKRFLLSLFEQGLSHSTVLRLNGEIIASTVGTIGKDCVHLQGINTHAPSYAQYSPGILHFLMLGKLLADEGVGVFDLTPGDSYYKDELATEYGLTYELTVCNIYSYWADHIKFHLVEHLKKFTSAIGIKPAIITEMKRRAFNFRVKIAHVKRQGLPFWIKSIIRQVVLSGRPRKYIAQSDVISGYSDYLNINKNSLFHLLHFEGDGTWMTRQDFLADAMRRFELMQSAYTFYEDGTLLSCVWLSNGKEGASLLDGFYYHPAVQNRLESFLAAVASAVAKDQQGSQVYAVTTSNDKILQQALEAIGFKSEVL